MRSRRSQAGFTLIEGLVVMALIGIVFGTAMWGYFASRNYAQEESRRWHSAMMGLRTQAMANTEARRMLLIDGSTVQFQSAKRCDAVAANWQGLQTVKVKYPNRVSLEANDPPITPPDPTLPLGTKLIVCFTSRGLGSTSGFLKVKDSRHSYEVQAALGGGVRTVALP